MKYISKLQDISNIAPITENLDGWVVTDGTPTMKTWILSTSHDESMISGYWGLPQVPIMRPIPTMSLCILLRVNLSLPKMAKALLRLALATALL